MRIYQTATIVEERLTGFQSPCSEFAEKPLSLDEKFGIGNPSLFFVQVESDFPLFGVQKKDWLLIDLSLKPSAKSLVVTIADDDVKLFKGLVEHPELEDVRVGVVVTIIRDYR
jgi:hypothetical protein